MIFSLFSFSLQWLLKHFAKILNAMFVLFYKDCFTLIIVVFKQRRDINI